MLLLQLDQLCSSPKLGVAVYLKKKYITQECGFLNNLEYGDCVLADRGLNVAVCITWLFMELKLLIPSYTKGKDQLSKMEIGESIARRLAQECIHAERKEVQNPTCTSYCTN